LLGTFTWRDGDKYAGEFRDDDQHGKGIVRPPLTPSIDFNKPIQYTYANGNKYKGEWEHDERHGNGTFTWASGNRYCW